MEQKCNIVTRVLTRGVQIEGNGQCTKKKKKKEVKTNSLHFPASALDITQSFRGGVGKFVSIIIFE